MIVWNHSDNGIEIRQSVSEQLTEFESKVMIEYTKRGYSKDTALIVYTMEKFMQVFYSSCDDGEDWKE